MGHATVGSPFNLKMETDPASETLNSLGWDDRHCPNIIHLYVIRILQCKPFCASHVAQPHTLSIAMRSPYYT
jgi:hypothetical protein